MSKKTKAPKKNGSAVTKAVKKVTQHWTLGVFVSASNGAPIVLYCKTDGVVSAYYTEKVKTKKALFHASYSGMTYAEARAQLLKDAAKANGKTKALLAEAKEKKEEPVAAK